MTMLNCPFCGSEPTRQAPLNYYGCSNHDCILWGIHATVEEWNKRYTPDGIKITEKKPTAPSHQGGHK